MQATPIAAIGFIGLVFLLKDTGAPASVLTFTFLVYAPAYLLMSMLWDKITIPSTRRNHE